MIMLYSNRERDIISCLLYLKSSKAIASILNISHRTVDNFIRQIMIKAKINSRDRLILYFQNDKDLSLLKDRYFTLITNYYFNIIISKLKITKTLDIYCSNKKNNNQEAFNAFIKKLSSIKLKYNVVKHIDALTEKNNQLIFISKSDTVAQDIKSIKYQNNILNSRIFSSFDSSLTNTKNTPYFPLGIRKTYLLNILKILNQFSSSKINEDIQKFQNLINNLFDFKDIDIKFDIKKQDPRRIHKIPLLLKLTCFSFILGIIIFLCFYIFTKNVRTSEGLPEKKDQNFIGRKDELRKLYNLIAENNVILISGPKGVGKTAFLNFFLKKHNIDNVYWSNANIKDNFYNLYLKIGLDYNLINTSISKETILSQVRNYNKKISDIYVVVYNVENLIQIEQYLNNMIKGEKLIVISSNSGLKRTGWGKNSFIDISPFNKQEAIEYVKRQEGILNVFDENTIINNLGTLPKNLEVFIKKWENNPFYTIDDFNAQALDVHKKNFDQLIQKHGMQVVELFYYITLLGNVDINFALLSSLMNLRVRNLQNMLISLESYSFIEITSYNKAYCVTINRDIREDVSRFFMPTIPTHLKQKYINNITEKINKTFPAIDEIPDKKWQDALLLFPQIEYFIKNSQIQPSEAYMELLEKIGRFNYHVYSNIKEAIKTMELVVSQRKLFNLSQIRLATALSFLGTLHEASFIEENKALQYKYEALKLLEYSSQNIKLRIQILEDIATLLYRTDNINKVQQGIKSLNKVITLKKEVYLKKPEEIAKSYDNLGCAYIRLGNPNSIEKGIQYRKYALSLLKDHKNSLLAATISNNIGWTYNKINNQTHETYYLLKNALSIVDNFYPSDKILKGTILYNIGVYHIHHKQCKSAITYFKESLSIRKEIYSNNSIKIKQITEFLEKINNGNIECVA